MYTCIEIHMVSRLGYKCNLTISYTSAHMNPSTQLWVDSFTSTSAFSKWIVQPFPWFRPAPVDTNRIGKKRIGTEGRSYKWILQAFHWLLHIPNVTSVKMMSDTGLTKVNYLSYWIHILPNATSPGHSGKKRIVCCISICWGAPPKKKSIQILKKKEVKREWSAALVFVERSLPSEFQQCARLTLTSQHLILLILMSLIEMYLVYLSCQDKDKYKEVQTSHTLDLDELDRNVFGVFVMSRQIKIQRRHNF